MTYCVAIKLNAGLVLMSDTRTNAGVDNVSRFRKMYTWEVPGNRAIASMSSGNLSITQGITNRISAAIKRAENGEDVETILNAPTMFRVAQIFGETMREMQDRHRATLIEQGAGADALILVAGQINGGDHRIFLIYSAGNFIEATEDTPFLQIGEHKYGKPILDRVITPDTAIEQALKAVFLSMDSTLRSNLSVGMPLDLAVIPVNSYRFSTLRRIEAEDPDWQAISTGWAEGIIEAFSHLPDVDLTR
ncbi:peptidase [Rhodobacteraceae bacterium NNCM2]|nr:peptidase [Coraliihabitans acroporae]